MKFHNSGLHYAAMAAMVAVAPTVAAEKYRNVMYHYEGATTLPGDKSVLQGITHVILSFANMTLLTDGQGQGQGQGHFTAFDEKVADLRQHFDSGTKFGAALGGWEESPKFMVAEEDGTRGTFIQNIMKFVDDYGLDLIDIDWEYPGGGGIDYQDDTTDSKDRAIEAFPKLLRELGKQLHDKNKELSIAVAGKLDDIEVYRKKATEIWGSVDFVNVMTYDLMNRRDTTTAHSSSIKAVNDTITKYVDELKLPAEKVNLGFPFYAKFATLDDLDCQGPLGCKLAPAEDASGNDTHAMDAITFESHHYQAEKVTALTDTTGKCGSNGKACASNQCCSRFGQCGVEPAHCGYMCLAQYGAPCNTEFTDMMPLFREAMAKGAEDKEAGATWYINGQHPKRYFWTWDSVDIVKRKINEIVRPRKLGGVMAWTLGEDSHGWEHVKVIRDTLANGPDDASAGTSSGAAPGTTATGTLAENLAVSVPVVSATAASSVAVPATAASASPTLSGGFTSQPGTGGSCKRSG